MKKWFSGLIIKAININFKLHSSYFALCLACWVKISTDNILKYLCFVVVVFFFSENSFWHFIQIVSNGDNLQVMTNLLSGKNKKKLEYSVDGAPSKIPSLLANVASSMTDGWTDGWIDWLALARPYHMGRSCSQFGLIPHSGLGGDCVMDRWLKPDTWTHRKIMLLSHTIAMRGSDVASLVEFHPVV